MMFTTRALARLDITGVQWRVLAILASVRNKETMESRIMVKEIASTMDVPHTNVSRALTELASRGIVFKMGTGVYRINTNVAYIGDKLASSADLVADPEPEWSRSGVHA